ncbi:MAG: SpoIID/LytB domain-containing protein [Candidatus Sumerlaeales bacterium]|nr:SpoIID/LytB domain-containing protein [Candidatus Sumerlaeales bacterium]
MKHILTAAAIISVAILAITTTTAYAKEVEGIANKTIKIDKNPGIKVLLMNSTTTITLTPQTTRIVYDKNDKQLDKFPLGSPITLTLKNGKFTKDDGKAFDADMLKLVAADPEGKTTDNPDGIIAIKQVPFGVGWWWESAEDRIYRGNLELYPNDKNKIDVVLTLPLEEYLRGVVPSEIGGNSPVAALGAQAVAARSAAVLALTTKIYAGSHHHITSDVDSQAFSGLTKCTDASDTAVKETAGVILSFEGRPVSAYYASNCGGYTEDIRNVWDNRANDKAYWDAARFDGEPANNPKIDLTTDAGVKQWIANPPDAYCKPANAKVDWAKSNWRWERQTTIDEITKLVAKHKDIGTIKEIKATKRGPSGRMIQCQFIGEKGTFEIGPELKIRSVWEPPLKSSVFTAETTATLTDKDKAGKPGFILRGAGWGHGVGMCQTGAVSMARLGKTYKQILNHYFPNCTLEKLY